ncbi:MAG: decaprenylphospho-beta-D-ribofuranose 2-oxidase [Blastocatellia bacterium]|nr:decaprenylphospho-beta-D-ribofuranose 2-oxidase [Blastocatellia bacterium]
MGEVRKVLLSGWGRYPRALSSVVCPSSLTEVAPPAQGQMIAHGQGRSYGDAALVHDGLVMLTERLDRVIAFDEATGILKAEAGMTLERVLTDFVSKGWFPPVTPGTKFVSLGGCVAADVHGKNHHRDGTFGSYVRELEMAMADGSRRVCSPLEDAELFWSTIGGMGLTGIITRVSLQLIQVESAYVKVQHHRATDLDCSLSLLEDSRTDDRYTVAWIDCLAGGRELGRSVLMRGHHATRAELPAYVKEPLRLKTTGQRNLPFDFPNWVLNSFAMTAFNKLYYWRQGARKVPFVTSCESFFYPLDMIGNWNRMYGKRGFVQYQCVFPTRTARRGLRILLEKLAASRRASFLAVLKRFGPEGPGLLSFPMEGYTLSLDLPVSDPALFPFLDQLDETVLREGGRVYLAKDARMKAETFAAMYPRLPAWKRVKASVDPLNRFTSDLARRLGL